MHISCKQNETCAFAEKWAAPIVFYFFCHLQKKIIGKNQKICFLSIFFFLVKAFRGQPGEHNCDFTSGFTQYKFLENPW